MNFVAQVKRNQKSLFNKIYELMLEETPLSYYETEEKGHGRHDFWSVTVYNSEFCIKAKEWFNSKRYIEVRKFSKNLKTNKTSESSRVYISNLKQKDAEFYHNGIRKHWKIENNLHWSKDVFHKEDKNRIRNKKGAVNISTISTFALNLLKINFKKSIFEAIKYCQSNLAKIIKIMRT